MVLSYEQEVRNHAMRLIVDDALSFEKALRQAWGDKDIRDRYFTTPLKLEMGSGTKRPPPTLPGGGGPPGGPPGKIPKGNPKGKGKGKDKGKKGKGKGKGKIPNNKTPDGTNICFKFNKTSCNRANCPFAHVCAVCFDKGHSMKDCPQN